MRANALRCVLAGGVLLGVMFQPRAGLAAVAVTSALALVVPARWAAALLVALVVGAQLGLRIDAAPPPPSAHPLRPPHSAR
jgi:hypothetical protein